LLIVYVGWLMHLGLVERLRQQGHSQSTMDGFHAADAKAQWHHEGNKHKSIQTAVFVYPSCRSQPLIFSMRLAACFTHYAEYNVWKNFACLGMQLQRFDMKCA
jgi:hypothetical protein